MIADHRAYSVYMQKRSGHASAVVAEKTEATRFENVIGLLRSVN